MFPPATLTGGTSDSGMESAAENYVLIAFIQNQHVRQLVVEMGFVPCRAAVPCVMHDLRHTPQHCDISAGLDVVSGTSFGRCILGMVVHVHNVSRRELHQVLPRTDPIRANSID
jgi:hypothetical protein